MTTREQVAALIAEDPTRSTVTLAAELGVTRQRVAQILHALDYTWRAQWVRDDAEDAALMDEAVAEADRDGWTDWAEERESLKRISGVIVRGVHDPATMRQIDVDTVEGIEKIEPPIV